MKIFHCADVHLHASTAENVEHAMGQALDLARAEKPDLIVCAGDLSLSATTLTPDVSEKLRAWFVALAEVCPVIVVAGNHDLNKSGGAGVLRGVLSESAAKYRIHLFDEPRVCAVRPGDAADIRVVPFADEDGLPIACLPYPNRAYLAARFPDIPASELNARASELLEEIVRGLAAQMPGPGLLVFHGTINGAKTSTERKIESDADIILRESAIPDVFEGVLCGHIHRPQQIGRAFYSGSMCPLDHGEENHPHGVAIWTPNDPTRGGRGWVIRFVELEPKHRLLTITLPTMRQNPDPIIVTEHPDVRGAKVRVKATVERGVSPDAVRQRLTENLLAAGAHSVTVTIEREAEDRACDSSSVRADASLPSLIAAYCERNPDAAEHQSALVALAQELDGQLSPEARALQHLGDYRLVAFESENFKSFGVVERIEMDSLGALTLINGENHNGKSNLLEHESFAFWGRTPRGKQALSEYVRIGTDEMRVSAEFIASGQLYRVRRSVELNGKGEGKSTLLLERMIAPGEYGHALPLRDERPLIVSGGPDGTWLPCSNGNARETQAQIERLVGEWDLYLKTRFAAQNQIDALLNLTAGEMKDTLQSALALIIYEHRETLARARASATEKRSEILAAEVSVLDQRAEGLEAAREAATAAEQAKEEQAGRVEAARAQIGESEARLEPLRRDVAEAEALEQRRTASRARLAAISARSDELALERGKADECVLRGEEAQKALDAHAENDRRLTALRAQADGRAALVGAEIEAAARYANDLNTRAQGQMRLGRERDQAQKDVAENTQLLTARRKGWTSHKDATAAGRVRELESAEQSIEAERKTASMIGTTPFGEQCAERGCQLLALPIAARDRLPALEDALKIISERHERERAAEAKAEHDECSALEAKAFALERRLADLEKELRELKASDEAAISGLRRAHTEAKAALAAYSFDATAYAELRDLVETFDGFKSLSHGFVRDGIEAKGRIQAIDAEHDTLAEEGNKVVEELEDGRPADALEQAQNALANEIGNLDYWRDVHDRAQRFMADRVGDLAGASANLAGLERDAQAAALKREALTAAQAAANVARIYARAMGRDGVPFLLLERVAPALEAHVNHFLGDDELRVEIEVARDLRSGDQKSEVYVRFRDGLGLHTLAAASGEQRVKLGIALRFAVARVQAEANGFTPSHVLWDEGFGALDESQKLVGQGILRRVAEWGGRVLFISHDEAIKEAADTRLEVAIVDGASHVTVAG